MKIFIASTLYIIILFSFLQNWWLLTGVSLLGFSFRYGAVTLIPLAILFDGYFGNFFTVPYASLAAVIWFVLVDYLRPKLTQFRAQ
jgi:hypothetical protein